ncbi:hypothetical protein [Eudoraea sp.]|uniref:hypothetical protein n=1 Tax=Eudoraea sp. TaxID=1979955 RepID=UPI003C73F9B7
MAFFALPLQIVSFCKFETVKATSIILMGILLLYSMGVQAQKTTKKVKLHKVWISLTDSSKVKGVLYSADKNAIKIAKNYSMDVSNLTSINYQNLDILKIRRKGKVGKGAWIGALSGVGAGIIIGLIDGDDELGWFSFTKEEKALASGIYLGAVGTGIGALIATKKEKIAINGDNQKYEKMLKTIQSYSFTPN